MTMGLMQEHIRIFILKLYYFFSVRLTSRDVTVTEIFEEKIL